MINSLQWRSQFKDGIGLSQDLGEGWVRQREASNSLTGVRADLDQEEDWTRALDLTVAKVSCTKSVWFLLGSHQLQEKPAEREEAVTQSRVMKPSILESNRWLMTKLWHNKPKSKWSFMRAREDLSSSNSFLPASRIQRLTCLESPTLSSKLDSVLLLNRHTNSIFNSSRQGSLLWTIKDSLNSSVTTPMNSMTNLTI